MGFLLVFTSNSLNLSWRYMLGPCDKQNFKNFLDLVVLVNVETTILIKFL